MRKSINSFVRIGLRYLLAIASIPVVLVLGIIRPFVLIRLGYFFSDRIGHFAFDVEYYLCQEQTRKKSKLTLDYFYMLGVPCNSALVTMVKRKVNINNKVALLCQAIGSLPFADSHIVRPAREINGSRDIEQLFHSTPRNLEFSSSEMSAGREYLQSIGLTEGHKYVCLLVRDPAYLATKFDRDMSYHGYRDSDIKAYEKSAKALTKRGYWVFRMGSIVEKSFDCDDPRIIDYATSTARSELLDIWLMAHCTFAISTSTGLDAISEVFRIPMIFVNHLPVGNLKTGDSRDIELFKILRWKLDKRRLSLSEHISTGAIYFQSSTRYQDSGLEIEDNTEEDIMGAVLEMEARLAGTWIEEPGDENLQRKFYSIIQSWDLFNYYHGNVRSRISTTFLRNNHDWFLS